MRTILESLLLFLQKRKNAQTLIFFITSRCNALCDFCLYKDFLNDKASKDRELTIDEINSMTKKYGALHFLSLSGGEPFIRRDIIEICESFILNCNTKVIDIPSNCFYSERIVESMSTLCRRYPDRLFQLQLSIDHIDEKHDEIRKVKGLYKKAIETFNRLNSLDLNNLKLNINIVYLKENSSDLPQIIKRVKSDFKCDRISVGYLNKIIEHKEKLDDFVKFKKISNETVLENVSKVFNPFILGMKVATLISNDLLGESLKEELMTSSYCKAGENIIVVTEKGDVYPCEPIWESIGSLRAYDYDIKRVTDSQKYKDFKEKYLSNQNCNCTWSCAMTSAVATNKSFVARIPIKSVKVLGLAIKKLVF